MKAGFVAGISVLAGSALFLSSCATTTPSPQQFRTFFVPPSQPAPKSTPPIDPPVISAALYANEVPNLTNSSSLPALPRAGDVDFLMKRADDRFAAGKRALQEGRTEDARREFDRAVESLLAVPENLPERSRLELHLEQMIEAIYRYDVDQLSASGTDEEVGFDQSPLDGILNLTFPVDPSLRNKVQDQIRATASQLPLQESDAVVSFINFFSSNRGSKIIAAGLRRSGKYKPMIERILREEGVPQELIFLAQAESGFSPRAMSKAKCVGIWQFAAFRGHEYGLNQTPAKDDRMDPEQATRAAAQHLHDLYNHFGDWYLAMAAYNCGPGCVDRAIQRTGYADFWQLRRLNVLPKETSNYVPLILAMTIMAKNAPAYGLDGVAMDPALEYDNIDLESSTHLGLIAEAIDRPLSELREMNPSLLHSTAPGGYRLHLPKGSLEQVQAAFQVVPASHRDSWRLHRVESGETFAALAKQFNTGATAISSANHEELPDAGGWVAIPVAYAPDRAPARAVQPKASASRKTTTARRTAAGSTGKAASVKSARTPSSKTTVQRKASGPKSSTGPLSKATARRTPATRS